MLDDDEDDILVFDLDDDTDDEVLVISVWGMR